MTGVHDAEHNEGASAVEVRSQDHTDDERQVGAISPKAPAQFVAIEANGTRA